MEPGFEPRAQVLNHYKILLQYIVTKTSCSPVYKIAWSDFSQKLKVREPVQGYIGISLEKICYWHLTNCEHWSHPWGDWKGGEQRKWVLLLCNSNANRIVDGFCLLQFRHFQAKVIQIVMLYSISPYREHYITVKMN